MKLAQIGGRSTNGTSVLNLDKCLYISEGESQWQILWNFPQRVKGTNQSLAVHST